MSRLMLEACGFPTEPRRIHSLFFNRGEEPRVLQVGVEDYDTGEPILLILRAANAPFYWVCTFASGILEGAPIPCPRAR